MCFSHRLLLRKDTMRTRLLCKSDLLLLSFAHQNCAATAEGFPREDKTRLFWLRSYRKDAHLPLSSGCFHCSVPTS